MKSPFPLAFPAPGGPLHLKSLPELELQPPAPEIDFSPGGCTAEKPTPAGAGPGLRGWQDVSPHRPGGGAPRHHPATGGTGAQHYRGDRAPVEPNQTTRWEIKEGADGDGESLRQHLFSHRDHAWPHHGTAYRDHHARTYYLTCKSVGKSPIRTVRWRYPVDGWRSSLSREPGLLPNRRNRSSTMSAMSWWGRNPPGSRAKWWMMERRTSSIRKGPVRDSAYAAPHWSQRAAARELKHS